MTSEDDKRNPALPYHDFEHCCDQGTHLLCIVNSLYILRDGFYAACFEWAARHSVPKDRGLSVRDF